MGNDDIKKIFQEVLGVSRAEAGKMLRRGYDTLESVAEAGTDELVQSLKLDFKTALEMIDKAYDYLHDQTEAAPLSFADCKEDAERCRNASPASRKSLPAMARKESSPWQEEPSRHTCCCGSGRQSMPKTCPKDSRRFFPAC